jgi:hypothetical protein
MPRRLHTLVWIAIASMATGGCARQLVLDQPPSTTPVTTITYTGVRSDMRRFADYGSIDASILADAR